MLDALQLEISFSPTFLVVLSRGVYNRICFLKVHDGGLRSSPHTCQVPVNNARQTRV